MIQRSFESLLNTDIKQISVAHLEQWRTHQKKQGKVKASSLNREATALKSAINWAVHMDIIQENPITKFKLLPEHDSGKIVRYLSNDERARLMAALDEREKELRQARESHNQWCEERGLAPHPQFGHFADHIKPVVLLSLFTGGRRKAVFSLEWRDVNFEQRILTLRGEAAKTEKTIYVSMSDTVFNVLSKWREQSPNTNPNALVFPSPKTGKILDNCNSAWEVLLQKAKIEKFRWHDMRHDFASQLVMGGVDLNTVRELLGHTDLKMTLRYAHLAPENKLQAVKILDKNLLPDNI